MRSNRLSLTLFVILCGFVTFIACNKYKDSNPPSTDLPADKLVVTSIQGRVLDENGVPVTGAVVSGGGKDTTTDVNGVFTFKDIQVSSRFAFVKVVKSGYFAGSKSVITNAAGSNYVTINLIPRTSKGSFAAAGGGTVVVQDGDTVVFGASAVVTASTGVAYSGTVHVFAAYLDPTDKDLSGHMPGDLRGIGKDGKETGLQTFGMMVVELEGDGGEKLQITTGRKATISLRIPAALQAAAASTIPLWYFNDSTGKWMEEGSATRQGNNYVGQVGHFSYWNCDAYVGLVNFKVHLKDQYGNPLANTYIQFQSNNFGVRGGYTDSSGYAQGLIPKGQLFVMQVMSQCGSALFGENVGPTLSDQDLGTLTVTVGSASLTLTGTVVDCNNSPVANGFISAFIDGLNYRAAVTNGSFTLSIVRCSNTTVPAYVTAGDYGTVQQGPTDTVTVTGGDVNIGQLSACGIDYHQSININLAGSAYNWTGPPDSIKYSFNNFYGKAIIAANSTTQPNLRINFRLAPPNGTGTYALDSMIITTQQNSSYYQGGAMNCSITSYGPVNGFIEGNFTGPVYLYPSPTPVTVTGNFRLRRTF